MKDRPILELQKERFDKVLDLSSLFFMLLLIAIPLIYSGSLPDRVPSHFNASGKPDAYSGQWVIWLLPMIGLGSYLGLRKLSSLPHTYNYPIKLTEENIHDAYLNGSRMMKSMSVIILGAFSYITFMMVQSAKGNYNGLGQLFLPFFICLLFGAIFFYSYRMMINRG